MEGGEDREHVQNAEAAEERTASREAFDPLSGQSLGPEGKARMNTACRWCAPSRQVVRAVYPHYEVPTEGSCMGEQQHHIIFRRYICEGILDVGR